MHVSKTAGSTFTGVLSNRFAVGEILELYFASEADLDDLDRYRYVSGHVTAAFLERFRRRPFVFTLLRDPIDRALSSYSFTRAFPGTNQQVFFPDQGPEAYERYYRYMRLARECSIEELIDTAPDIARERFGNRQARALSGTTKQGEERLSDAIEGLERCDFVGLTDRLDESATWLARRLGWRDLSPIPVANASAGRLQREGLSPAALDALREWTSVDRELYRFARARFERQISAWSAEDVPRDRAADIPDAPSASDLSFDDPIPGGGWLGRERIEGEPMFCWIGSSNRAWVDLAPDPAADSLRIEIPHAMDARILRTLRISVDGRRVDHHLAESNGTTVAIASLSRLGTLHRSRSTRVSLEVDDHLRPSDVDPSSIDNRQLSIAVRRIALQSS
jgi:hypothetical protein